MNFQIAGKRYEVAREDVMDATRNVPPTVPDARHKYFVNLHNRQYPIKQVIRLVTGYRVRPSLYRMRRIGSSPRWVSTYPIGCRQR